MGIREHIERRQANENVKPLIERRGGTEQRVPLLVRLAREGKVPTADRTGQMKVAA